MKRKFKFQLRSEFIHLLFDKWIDLSFGQIFEPLIE